MASQPDVTGSRIGEAGGPRDVLRGWRRTDTPAPLLPPVAFADLPRHRQLGLLWRLAGPMAGGLDRDDVEQYMLEWSPYPCWTPQAGLPGVAAMAAGLRSGSRREAVLGSDGRYHLVVDGIAVCMAGEIAEQPFRHSDVLWWFTDGFIYRVQPFVPERPGPLAHGECEVTWMVSLTEVSADPAVLPAAARCPIGAGSGAWPRFLGGGKTGRVAATLVEMLGPACHACDTAPGVFVDHDHFTGIVRGLLCRDCNTVVDRCPHLSRCLYATYLGDPPAAKLQLRYPKMDKTIRDRKKRMAVIGISSLDELWTRRRAR